MVDFFRRLAEKNVIIKFDDGFLPLSKFSADGHGCTCNRNNLHPELEGNDIHKISETSW